jgi:DNA repair exonuclease SbcCD ATPase subunit
MIINEMIKQNNNYKENIKNKVINEENEKEIKKLDEQIRELDIKIEEEEKRNIEIMLKTRDMEHDRNMQEIKNGEHMRIKDRIKEIDNKINKVEEQCKIYKNYKIIMMPNNFPAYICDKYLRRIEKEMNNIMRNNIDFEIRLILEENNLIIEKRYKNSIINQTIDISSGYESLLIGLGFKIGLKNIINISSGDIMIIDEVIDCINIENYDKIGEMIKMICNSYDKVVIISHNENIKEIINNEEINKYDIEIVNEKENNNSYIK